LNRDSALTALRTTRKKEIIRSIYCPRAYGWKSLLKVEDTAEASLHDQLKKELSYVIHNHLRTANNTLESTMNYKHQKELQTHLNIISKLYD
jgi:predicted transcriptional regulator